MHVLISNFSPVPGEEQLVRRAGISAMLRCYLLPATHKHKKKPDEHCFLSFPLFTAYSKAAVQVTHFLGSDLRQVKSSNHSWLVILILNRLNSSCLPNHGILPICTNLQRKESLSTVLAKSNSSRFLISHHRQFIRFSIQNVLLNLPIDLRISKSGFSLLTPITSIFTYFLLNMFKTAALMPTYNHQDYLLPAAILTLLAVPSCWQQAPQEMRAKSSRKGLARGRRCLSTQKVKAELPAVWSAIYVHLLNLSEPRDWNRRADEEGAMYTQLLWSCKEPPLGLWGHQKRSRSVKIQISQSAAEQLTNLNNYFKALPWLSVKCLSQHDHMRVTSEVPLCFSGPTPRKVCVAAVFKFNMVRAPSGTARGDQSSASSPSPTPQIYSKQLDGGVSILH